MVCRLAHDPYHLTVPRRTWRGLFEQQQEESLHPGKGVPVELAFLPGAAIDVRGLVRDNYSDPPADVKETIYSFLSSLLLSIIRQRSLNISTQRARPERYYLMTHNPAVLYDTSLSSTCG